MADLDTSDTPNTTGGAPAGDASPETVPHTPVTLDMLGTGDQVPEGAILNRDGTVRKKPGRKPGQKNGMKASEVSPADAPAPKAPQSPAEKKAVRLGCDQTARMVLNTSVGILCELVGEEWNFTSQEEADAMRITLASYIEAKGGGEMSPEMALLLASTGYAAPRFRHPNTRQKFGAFFGKAWEGFKALFKR